MQFIDLQEQYKRLKQEIDKGIQDVLDNSNYIMGKQVKDLELLLAEYVGVKHCVTCGNGTDALLLALMAYDIKAGDAVFVPTFTYYASSEVISACGATPVFVDVDKHTFNIHPIDFEEAIKEVIREDKLIPKAIIAVDLFGLPFDYRNVAKISKKYNLLLIEDGAQGFGGSINEKLACSFGDISTTSFFPAKPLGCYGDGGAIFTNNVNVKEHLESLRNHGMGNDKYDNVRVGMNSRLDTMQAAILLPKLKAFKEYELEARNNAAKLYDKHLSDVVKTQCIPEGFRSSFAQYSILLMTEEQRDIVQQSLKDNGVPSMIYYKKSMHQQTVYRDNKYIDREFNNAEEISKTILNLPMDPYLSEETIAFISSIIIQSLNVYRQTE